MFIGEISTWSRAAASLCSSVKRLFYTDRRNRFKRMDSDRLQTRLASLVKKDRLRLNQFSLFGWQKWKSFELKPDWNYYNCDLHLHVLYAFSRRFYPKCPTADSRYTFISFYQYVSVFGRMIALQHRKHIWHRNTDLKMTRVCFSSWFQFICIQRDPGYHFQGILL